MNPGQGAALSAGAAVMWGVIGILLSLVLSLAVRTLAGAKKLEGLNKNPTVWQRRAAVWQRYGGNKYVMVVFASVIVALVLVFLIGGEFKSVKEAVLFGFAWEGL